MNVVEVYILILLLFIVCILGGLLFILNGVSKYLLIQKINNLPTSKVRSAAIGLIELFGKARCKEELLSPISNKPCVYWNVSASYKDLRDRQIGIFFRDRFREFYLEDNTGKMLVDPKKADLDLPVSNAYAGYLEGGKVLWADFQQLDKQAVEFIKSLNYRDRKEFMDHKTSEFQITETCIFENDKIYVLGKAQSIKDQKSHIAHETLVVKKGKSDLLYISNSHEHKIIEKIWFSMAKDILIGFGVFSIFLYLLLYYLGIN